MQVFKSCNYVEHGALALSPTALGACCFRYNDNKQGSALIKEHYRGELVNRAILEDWRRSTRARVAAGDITCQCTQCPMCVTQEWPDTSIGQILNLVITTSTKCQLACQYCWIKSEFKTVEWYLALPVLRGLREEGLIGLKTVACIGGGEPTLMTDFDAILQFLCGITSVFLPTNAAKFSPAIWSCLPSGKLEVVTSLDCATPALFGKLRGNAAFFDVVVSNAARYYSAAPAKFTLKYVLTYTNYAVEELDKFVELAKAKFTGGKIMLELDLARKVTESQVAAFVYLRDKLAANGHAIVIGSATASRPSFTTMVQALTATEPVAAPV